MTLRSDVLALRARSLTGLVSGQDHFDLSQLLWSDLLQAGKPSGASSDLSLYNAVTGSQLLGPNLRPIVTAAAEVYLPSAAVGHLVSVTEAFVFDLVRLWVLAHPLQLKGSVDAATIVAAADTGSLLEHLADRFVIELAYKSPRDWFRQLNDIVALGTPDEARVAAFAELKPTRDLFVHNRGCRQRRLHTEVRVARPSGRGQGSRPADRLRLRGLHVVPFARDRHRHRSRKPSLTRQSATAGSSASAAPSVSGASFTSSTSAFISSRISTVAKAPAGRVNATDTYGPN